MLTWSSDTLYRSIVLLCEQGMMQAKNYADFPPHKKAHDDFVAKLGTLSTPLSTDTIHFAKDWSVQHVVCF